MVDFFSQRAMDAKSRAVKEALLKSTANQNLLAKLRHMLISSPRTLLDSLKVLLPTSIFFIKFLEWWYSPSSPARSILSSSHHHNSSSSLSSQPPIPPPKVLPPHPQGLKVSRTKYGICPICEGALENATALPSGYVFCYRCVHREVEEKGRCPVTLTPARVWQLRRVLI